MNKHFIIAPTVYQFDDQRWKSGPWLLTGTAMLQRFPEFLKEIEHSAVGHKIAGYPTEDGVVVFERVK